MVIGGEKQIFNSEGNVSEWLELNYIILTLNNEFHELSSLKEGVSQK